MYILSVSMGHDASATLYNDYQRMVSVAEERTSRNKGAGYLYPWGAVKECLAQASVRLDQIDVLCLPYYPYPDCFVSRWFWPQKIRDYFAQKNPMKHKYRVSMLVRMIKYNRRHSLKKTITDPTVFINTDSFIKQILGVKPKTIFYYEHHLAHALSPLFHTTWDDGLIYTADGWGDYAPDSCRLLRNNHITDIFGDWQDLLDISLAHSPGDRDGALTKKISRRHNFFSSPAYVYGHVTELLGFQRDRHEGKVLGLAAFGKPVFKEEVKSFFVVNKEGRIGTNLEQKVEDRLKGLEALVAQHTREDVAASLQRAVEEVHLEALSVIIDKHKPKNIAVSGGLFANVLLNQKIVERFNLEQIFIYPAMGDAGQAAGGALQYLLNRDGAETWLKERYHLKDVYFGRDYDENIEKAFADAGAKRVESGLPLVEQAVEMIRDKKICALYQGRMEYGPRALGNRTIMAIATDHSINDWLNKRLSRTEFMPFAPVVCEEHADRVFDLPENMRYAARFMTITCNVKEAWHDKVPAIVHVDGTARPQLINREGNPLYYDILQTYEQQTGIPVLINTSFNAHEEPIINTPQEAATALKDKRVDCVITPKGIYHMAS